jgi:catechol 2,3-dioxygenase-like lactoylglutathione lyase family enzyme
MACMEKAVAILPTDDLAAAKAFYVGGLGFQVTWEHTEDGHSGLMGVARGDMEITLDCPMAGHGREACVSLHVDDADAYYNEWSSRNVAMLRAPKDEDWGARTFDLLDPSGNTIFVIGPQRTPA